MATKKNVKEEYKNLHLELKAIEANARQVLKSLDHFSFEGFRLAYLNPIENPNDVFSVFTDYIGFLKKEGRIGNAIAYKCALKSLEKFAKLSVLPFREITSNFLNRYEHWMIEEGNGLTTVGMYLRCVRHLYNQAIQKGTIDQHSYPFGTGTGKYRIPEPQNIKKALPLNDVKKIFTYKPLAGSREEFYRDIWIFSYLCNGININDICCLKYSDLTEKSVTFRRAKTTHTVRKSKPVMAARTEKVNEIIRKWGTTPALPDQYIFPFYKPGLTPEQQKARTAEVVKQTNRHIKNIGEAVGITAPITTYTARHSYATVLKRSGASIAYISETLGHKDLKTTEAYLDSFESDEQMKIAAKLTDW